MMAAVLQGLGLVLVIEGLLYALVPGHLRTMAQMLQDLPDATLKTVGAVAVAGGVGLVWLAKILGGT
jgi:hypothetical protein